MKTTPGRRAKKTARKLYAVECLEPQRDKDFGAFGKYGLGVELEAGGQHIFKIGLKQTETKLQSTAVEVNCIF